MLKRIIILLFIITIYMPGYAQQDTSGSIAGPQSGHSRLRISLVTCGMGNKIWETFGHSAIRIIDSSKNDLGRDLIYNYGMYDFFLGNFFWTFAAGKLNVYLGIVPYVYFIQEYKDEGRGVEEQEFVLDDAQKEQVLSFLKNNAEPGNNYYEYQIFFDNCCTRTQGIFIKNFGKDFIIGDALPKDFHLSYRTAFNLYYRNRYWERMVTNVGMGSTTDTMIRNELITFLPEFLSIAMENATINGKKICKPATTLLEDKINHATGINQPFILTCFIAFVTMISLSVKRLRPLGRIMSILVLIICELLGLVVFLNWVFSQHVYGSSNFNILWALPTSIFVAFFNFKGKGIYALACMFLIGVSLVLHILKVQIMPLFEIGPYLLALLFVYGDMYRNRSKTDKFGWVFSG